MTVAAHGRSSVEYLTLHVSPLTVATHRCSGVEYRQTGCPTLTDAAQDHNGVEELVDLLTVHNHNSQKD
jgi:hypothetical protein